MAKSTELVGVAFVLLTAILSGLRPALTKFGTANYPPILLAGFTVLFCAITSFAIFLAGKQPMRSLIPDQKKYFTSGIVGAGLAPLFLYLGLQTTSGIDASLFLQIELVYSLVICYFLMREKITLQQVFLTAIVFVGAIATLFKESTPTLSTGSMMILAVPLFYVLSNAMSKDLLKRHTPEAVSTMRQLYGALFLLTTVLLFEGVPASIVLNPQFLLYAAMLGILLTGVALCWYNAIDRVNVSKATAIGAVEVIISVIVSCIVLGEVPTLLQYFGIALIVVGTVLLAFNVKSEQRSLSAKV